GQEGRVLGGCQALPENREHPLTIVSQLGLRVEPQSRKDPGTKEAVGGVSTATKPLPAVVPFPCLVEFRGTLRTHLEERPMPGAASCDGLDQTAILGDHCQAFHRDGIGWERPLRIVTQYGVSAHLPSSVRWMLGNKRLQILPGFDPLDPEILADWISSHFLIHLEVSVAPNTIVPSGEEDCQAENCDEAGRCPKPVSRQEPSHLAPLPPDSRLTFSLSVRHRSTTG